MTELNQFCIATGSIDTSSEIPPLHIAIITLDHKQYQLGLLKRDTVNNQVTEEYAFEKNRLRLQYHKINIASGETRYEGSYQFQNNHIPGSAQNVIGIKGYL